MSAPEFGKLASELEAVGASPSVISRTLIELEDHCADVEAVALKKGFDRATARRHALECLGDLDAIVAAVAARPNLLSWRCRWPHAARWAESMSYCLLWPAVPFVYCATHPAGIVRWSLSSTLAICVTATILFILQLAFGDSLRL